LAKKVILVYLQSLIRSYNLSFLERAPNFLFEEALAFYIKQFLIGFLFPSLEKLYIYF